MKQILISLLAFMPLMSKADDVNVNGVHYYIKGDEAIAKRLLKGEIRKGALVIDSVVYHSGRAYPVTCIDMYSEEWGLKDSVTSVVIPNSVTEIRGFFRFKELTEVTIPNSVKIIEGAFCGCEKLDSIYIPSSVDSIADAFRECSLKRIVVDKNNKMYDSRENCNCIIRTATNSIVRGGNQSVIPSSVTSIDESAFRACDIERIDIPSSVKYIGSYAFDDCEHLSSVTISDSTQVGISVFCGCERLTSFNIPKGWAVIPMGTFQYSGLTSISIPDNIKQIQIYAFSGCEDMKTVKIPNSVDYIGGVAFENCVELSSVTIPNSVVYLGEGIFQGCEGLTRVKLPSDIKKISRSMFESCTDLEEINIPYGVTEIADGAFDGCLSLECLTIPATVEVIGKNAFSECGFTNLAIPSSVEVIDDGAFTYCQFSTITIPSNVVEIGEGAFSGCENLSSIIVDKGNPRYDSRNNSNCIIETRTNTLVQGCKESLIPTSVKVIGPLAFEYLYELKCIEIPGSVTEIGNGAFSWCENLEHITIPNSVNTLHRGAFEYCGKLTEFTIPASVKTISPDIFDNCSHITDVYLPGYKVPEVEVVKKPEGGAYRCCSYVYRDDIQNEDVVVPESQRYHSYVEIKTPRKVKKFTYTPSRNDFPDWVQEATLHVPASLVDYYRSTKPWSEFGRIEALYEETTPVGQGLVGTDDDSVVNAYGIDGTVISDAKKGINVMQYQNGKVRKIIK